MQTASCNVRLAGETTMTVHKALVTPAEIAVLRAVHGDDAVIDVKPIGMDKRPHKAEKSRLVAIYGEKRVDNLFPGKFPQLPVRIADIALEHDDAGDSPVQDAPAPEPELPEAVAEVFDGSGAAEGDEDDGAYVPPPPPRVERKLNKGRVTALHTPLELPPAGAGE